MTEDEVVIQPGETPDEAAARYRQNLAIAERIARELAVEDADEVAR